MSDEIVMLPIFNYFWFCQVDGWKGNKLVLSLNCLFYFLKKKIIFQTTWTIFFYVEQNFEQVIKVHTIFKDFTNSPFT